MKEIQVTEKYKILVIPHNYQLCEFVEGGKKVRNPATGETRITEEGWKPQNVFYANINAMVKHIARLEADDKAEDLNKWLGKYEAILQDFSANMV